MRLSDRKRIFHRPPISATIACMSETKPKRKRRLPVILKPKEAAALVTQACAASDNAETPVKQFAARRDFAMIQTGLLAGPRIAELCALEVTDIDLEGAVLMIRLGKGGRDRNVPFGKKLLRVLRWWIGKRVDGFLFPGPNGKKLARRTFQVRLAELAKEAGIPRSKAHPHALRHSFACSLLRSGSDIKQIMELMGHANLATTAIYLSVESDHLRAAVDRL
jgi:site-specific recombinase XerD